MKIAFVSNYFSGDELDAVTSSFFRLVIGGLRESGHNVEVFTLVANSNDLAEDPLLHCAGVDGLTGYEKFYQLNSFPVSSWILSRAVELRKRLESKMAAFAPDFIVCVKALDGLVWVKQSGPPVVLLSVTPQFEIMRLNFDGRFNKADLAMVNAMEISALRSMARISCPSADIRKAISNIAKISETEMTVYPHPIVMRNGIDCATSSLTVHSSLERNPTQSVVAYIGTLERYKGFDLLMRAVPSVLQRNTSVRFIFAGETPALFGEAQPYYRAVLGELDAESKGKIEVLEPLDESARRSLAFKADLVIYPFRYCGCMYHVIESMSAGAAVVASNTGSLSEFLDGKESCVLVPPESSAALADTIIELLDDPHRRTSLREYALNYVRENCSQKSLTEHIEKMCFEAQKNSSEFDPAAAHWLAAFESFCAG